MQGGWQDKNIATPRAATECDPLNPPTPADICHADRMHSDYGGTESRHAGERLRSARHPGMRTGASIWLKHSVTAEPRQSPQRRTCAQRPTRMDPSSTRHRQLLDIGNLDLLFLGRLAQLAQRPGLDLADPLLGDAHLGPDLLERQRLLARGSGRTG